MTCAMPRPGAGGSGASAKSGAGPGEERGCALYRNRPAVRAPPDLLPAVEVVAGDAAQRLGFQDRYAADLGKGAPPLEAADSSRWGPVAGGRRQRAEEAAAV